jgi:glutaminyl-peptide cyclotransferase
MGTLALCALLLAGCDAASPPKGAPGLPSAATLLAVTITPTSTSVPMRPPAATSTSVPTPTPTATETSTPELGPALTTVLSNPFSGQRAYDLVYYQTELGFRPTGSAAGWATGDWIIDRLTQAGWIVEAQEFVYQGVTGRNIVGRSSGTDGRPIVILGAHYDTRRRADRDPSSPGEPVLGANDGASGTAVLLELASSLDLDQIPYSVWLAFFDAEDNGNLDGWDWIVGSTYMASHLTIDPEFVIVVDMVGDKYQQIYYEGNSDAGLMADIWAVADALGYGYAFIPAYRHTILDDHIPFARLGVPAVDIVDFDYPHWHTTGDTLDKIDVQSLERVGRTLEAFLETGDNSETPNR